MQSKQWEFIRFKQQNEGSVITNGCFVQQEKWAFSSAVSREEASDLHNFPPKQQPLGGGQPWGGYEGRRQYSWAQGVWVYLNRPQGTPSWTPPSPFIYTNKRIHAHTSTPLLYLLRFVNCCIKGEKTENTKWYVGAKLHLFICECVYMLPFPLSFHCIKCKALSTCFFTSLFVCSAPKGFPCWKKWCYADVYCNRIPFQTYEALCSQCSSVADLLDLILKPNSTVFMIFSVTHTHTLIPERAAVTDINKCCQCLQPQWRDMGNSKHFHLKKYFKQLFDEKQVIIVYCFHTGHSIIFFVCVMLFQIKSYSMSTWNDYST